MRREREQIEDSTSPEWYDYEEWVLSHPGEEAERVRERRERRWMAGLPPDKWDRASDEYFPYSDEDMDEGGVEETGTEENTQKEQQQAAEKMATLDRLFLPRGCCVKVLLVEREVHPPPPTHLHM